jgi:hypothetical protein
MAAKEALGDQAGVTAGKAPRAANKDNKSTASSLAMLKQQMLRCVTLWQVTLPRVTIQRTSVTWNAPSCDLSGSTAS